MCARRLVGLFVGAFAALSAVAASEGSPVIEAVNKAGSGAYPEEHHAWSPAQVSVAADGAVTIRNPSTVAHGVQWISGPSTPTCSGVPVGTSPAASGTKWSGTCTFAQAGTYTFYCTVHGAEMTSTVTVSSVGAPPATSEGSPLAGSASEAIKLPSRQRGKAVRGSVALSSAGAGGRLQVDLLAKSASLASANRAARVRVGRLVLAHVHAGRASFAVALSSRARAALRRHGRLALTATVLIGSPAGRSVTIVRKVLMRP